MAANAGSSAELQSRLLAQGKSDNSRRVLPILQGMDTCGKDGVIRHVLRGPNPFGVRVASFEKPTRQDLAHHFLWRIKQQLPAPGIIGAFNRSYYEDVLVPRVHGEIPAAVLAQRYDDINSFERRLSDDGVVLVKCFLPIADSCGRGPPTFSGRIVRRWMTADRPLRSGCGL